MILPDAFDCAIAGFITAAPSAAVENASDKARTKTVFLNMWFPVNFSSGGFGDTASADFTSIVTPIYCRTRWLANRPTPSVTARGGHTYKNIRKLYPSIY